MSKFFKALEQAEQERVSEVQSLLRRLHPGLPGYLWNCPEEFPTGSKNIW